MNKCSKCNIDSEVFAKYRAYGKEVGPVYQLCPLCDRAFDIRGELLNEFMKDDFGTFPISQVTKNIINARRARSVGACPWTNEFKPNLS
jgi:hypothetical protein